MRHGKVVRFARLVPVVLLTTLALLNFYNTNANALSTYFTGQGGCSAVGCHPATPTTCDGCHAHGVHSSSAKNDINLTATTDAASYTSGATVTVTLAGGYLNGWVRANLYDNTGTLVDTSTGAGGIGGGAELPVTLTGIAPTTPGTYTFTAAWYGNAYDLTASGGGTTFFGPGWTPDATNTDHGEERVATNSFTVVGDNTAPTVLSTVPADAATGVALNTTVSATFSEPVDNTTVDLTSFFVTDGVDNVAGTFSFADNTVTFTPSALLAAATVYTATLTTAITDVAGNPLAADFTWSFTTGAGPDVTAPTVLSTVPADNAANVATNTTVRVVFDEPIAPATVDNASFFVSDGTDNVTGTFAIADNTVTFTPAARLADNTVYTATITTAITDVAGNPLAAGLVWSFTTGTTPPPAAGGDGGGCALAPAGRGASALPAAYGFLILVGLGAAVRKRMQRGSKR